jgi:DNA-binding MarR family transcriptional regulator
MDPSSDRAARVLHTLRCVGFTNARRIAAAAGLPVGDVMPALSDLVERGLVTEEFGPFGGWGITDRGRARDDEWLASELDAAGARETVRDCYEAFLPLNTELLAACSAWQMRTVGDAAVPNDHRDPDYDARVLDRLSRIDESAQSVLTSLAAVLSRFATYQGRLTTALERVMAGDHSYFTDQVDSYHTIWFQLHEDLLTTLGMGRN